MGAHNDPPEWHDTATISAFDFLGNPFAKIRGCEKCVSCFADNSDLPINKERVVRNGIQCQFEQARDEQLVMEKYQKLWEKAKCSENLASLSSCQRHFRGDFLEGRVHEIIFQSLLRH